MYSKFLFVVKLVFFIYRLVHVHPGPRHQATILFHFINLCGRSKCSSHNNVINLDVYLH